LERCFGASQATADNFDFFHAPSSIEEFANAF